MRPTILAILCLCSTLAQAKTEGWNLDMSDHETYRGAAAHFGVGALIGTGLYAMSIKSKSPLWHTLLFGIFAAELVNNIYEAATDKPPAYWLAMDVMAGAGVFAVGGVCQLAYWEGENHARGLALRVPFK